MNQNEPNRQPVTALCVQHSERSPILIADELDDGDAVAALVEFAAVRFFDQGMASQFVTHDAAQDTGALVIRMMRGSEAYNAGVRPGDVITGFNGTKIDDPSQLYRLVADAKIGSMATIKVFRSGRTLDVKVPIVSDARSRR